MTYPDTEYFWWPLEIRWRCKHTDNVWTTVSVVAMTANLPSYCDLSSCTCHPLQQHSNKQAVNVWNQLISTMKYLCYIYKFADAFKSARNIVAFQLGIFPLKVWMSLAFLRIHFNQISLSLQREKNWHRIYPSCWHFFVAY